MRNLKMILFLFPFLYGLHFGEAAGLFGGPRTLPDDGTWGGGGSTFSNPGGSCQVSCNSSKGFIQVDISSRCMCISGSTCFKVDIGKPGTYTSNGLGRMGRTPGQGKYWTMPGPGNASSFDQDAVSMGIASNTVYGKWIHKARDCQGGGQSTIGCIGVPCARWPLVKKLALEGRDIQVCNGVNYPTSLTCPGGGPCYKNISPSAAARDRIGLYSPKKTEDNNESSADRGHAR